MRVLVSEFMSLDGVVQAPGGKDEDTSGGFRHGGWSFEFFDPDVMGAVVDEYAERSEVLLQGRRTYQVSAAAWPSEAATRSRTGSTVRRSTSCRTPSPSRISRGADDHHPQQGTRGEGLGTARSSPAATSTCTAACRSCEPC